MRQKRSIKRNIELPVAIHEVRDGQRSRCLSSLIETFRFEDENDYEYAYCQKIDTPEFFIVLFFTGKVSTVIVIEEG